MAQSLLAEIRGLVWGGVCVCVRVCVAAWMARRVMAAAVVAVVLVAMMARVW